MVRRGDDYGINIFPPQEFSEVGICFASLVAARLGLFCVVILHLLPGGFTPMRIHVAHCNHLSFLLAQETAHQTTALHAVSDETKRDAVAWISACASTP